jgi:hypothetical protein
LGGHFGIIVFHYQLFVERWDTWTNAKVVIGKSNGAGVNKTEFNLKSLNIGMDRRMGITLLSPLALSTRLIKLLVWLSAKLT